MGFPYTILEQFGHFLSILGACNLGAKIKDLRMYVCMEEKIEFFLNYDKWLQQSRNAIMRL